MELETVLFSQDHPLIINHNYNYCKEYNNYDLYSYDFGNSNYSETIHNQNNNSFHNKLPGEAQPSVVAGAAVDGGGGRKKRRRKSIKNREEAEQQRMAHIAVERNRRKQMNEHLAVIRSLMPPSYSQRGDQASIVGGAINYVKELEHMVQSLQALKQNQLGSSNNYSKSSDEAFIMLGELFNFPQFPSTSSSLSWNSSSSSDQKSRRCGDEIEVRMVDGHAYVRILTKKKQNQLLRMVDAFQCLRLSLLHLNLTTLTPFLLYTFNLKVEEGCQLKSMDDVAAAVNHILANPNS